MPPTKLRSIVRLLAAALLVTAVVALAQVVRTGQTPESEPQPAGRSLSQPTPSSIPFASGSGYPEGAVPHSEASALAPPARSIALTVPLDAWAEVVDRFGTARGPGLVHGGIDFGFSLPESSPVYASCGGIVLFAGSNDSYGAHAVVNCGEGWTTVYAYLGQLYVSSGDSAAADTVLGLSDASGGPLHFEVRWQDVPLDPEAYLDLRTPRRRPPTAAPTAVGAEDRPRPTQAVRTPRPTVSPAMPARASPTATPAGQATATTLRPTTPTPVDER